MKLRTIIGAQAATAAVACAVLATSPPASADVVPAWDADDNPGLALEATATANVVESEFPEIDGMTIGSGSMTKADAVAQANGYGVVIGEQYASDPILLTQTVNDDVAAGFHPALGKCSAVQYIVLHESAHVIDARRGGLPSSRVAAYYAQTGVDGLSGYSYTSASEALAEAFASVICNGGNASERELVEVAL